MTGDEAQRRTRGAVTDPGSPTLAKRYGFSRPRPISAWLLAVAAVLTGAISISSGAGALGVLGAFSWGVILALSDKSARRPRAFLAGASLAVLVPLPLPLLPYLPDIFSELAAIPMLVLFILYAYGGIVPLVVTLVVTYLWFARTGRIP